MTHLDRSKSTTRRRRTISIVSFLYSLLLNNSVTAADQSGNIFLPNPISSFLRTTSTNLNNIAGRNRRRHSSFQSNNNSQADPYVQLTSSTAPSSSSEYEYDYDDEEYSNDTTTTAPTSPPTTSNNQQPSRSTIQTEQNRALASQLGPYIPYSLTHPPHPTSTETSLTSKLTLLNILLYGLQVTFPTITSLGIKRSDLLRSGRQLWRSVTPVFLHASPAHLIVNTLTLQRIGPEVERIFGHERYAATYLIGGIVGNLCSVWGTPNPSLGASGALFGLMGAYVTVMLRNERFFDVGAGGVGGGALDAVLGTMAMNVVYGLMSRGVDNWAHIGGAVGGVASAYYLGPKLYNLFHPTLGRVIVEKPNPLLRYIPPSVRTFPSQLSDRYTRRRRRLQGNRIARGVPANKPWRGRRRGSGGGGGGDGSGLDGWMDWLDERLGIGRRRRRRMGRRRRRRNDGLPLDKDRLKPLHLRQNNSSE